MDDIYKYLECPICLDLCNDPVEAHCCHSIYCKACAISIKSKCSLCKSQIFQFSSSIISKRMLDSIPVECDYCKEKSTRGNLESHLKRCPKRLFKCHFCMLEITKFDYPTHLISEHINEYENAFDKFYGLFNQEKDETKPKSQTSISIDTQTNQEGKISRLGESGKYYCGKKIQEDKCNCCDSTCGVSNGCNCASCMQLDITHRKLPNGWLVNSKGFNARKGNLEIFYCGRKVLNTLFMRSDGYCGPTDGPNCVSCQALDLLSKTRYNSMKYFKSDS